MTRIAASSPRSKDNLSAKAGGANKPGHRADEARETVESIVVAVILALLVRAFAVEAFVIPTGSMAPTLMGRHKEIACPQCGHVFPVNAAEEADPTYDSFGRPFYPRVKLGTCSNCRFQSDVSGAPSFKGDRILVMKFPYTLPMLPGAGGPSRWDVVVFNYPEIPEQNYIKRLVGLPNEALRIHAGDIMTHAGHAPFVMQHKPLNHQRAMQVLVYDDAHRPRVLEGRPEWLRWASRPEGPWNEGVPGSFSVGTSGDWARLRYRHLVADPKQWEALARGSIPATPPRATLITDFNSYNTGVTFEGRDPSDGLDPHWVGDLTIEFRIEVTSTSGRFRVELVRGGIPYRCEIDVATGQVQLYRGDQAIGSAVNSGVKGPGTHDLAFANVDGRLTLWVDGETPFGEGVIHDDGQGPRPVPTAADLDPAGVAARGLSARISRLRLSRDIYYTLAPSRADYGSLWDLVGREGSEQRAVAVFDLLADPSRFARLADLKPSDDYVIRPGHYMMMGDNSPRSKDGRAWTTLDQGERGWDKNERASHEVPASLLIGKAFFVYWPHGVPFWPNIGLPRNSDFRIPFRPYFERMKWIR